MKIDIAKIMFLGSVAVAIFCYGIAVSHFGIFPKNQLVYLRDSVIKVYNEQLHFLGSRPVHLIQPARYEGEGVARNDPEKAAPGLTFLASFFDNSLEMRLIRLDGTVVHRWPVVFSELFPNTDHIQPEDSVPVSNWHTFIHGAVVLPDGSVVFNFEYHGLVKLDRCGAVEWKQPLMTHHSIDHASDGGFWISGRRYTEEETELRFAPARPPYLEDFVTKISAEGEILKEISVPKLLMDNGLWPLFLANGLLEIDIPEMELLHLNDIEELMAEDAAAFPQFEAGDLVISLRELNLVLVFDPETEVIKWHRTGPWLRQHDPDFQPDGTITVFDNRSDDTKTGEVLGGSRVTVWDAATGKTGTLQPLNAEGFFYTEVGGKHQVLPNGNVLVTEYESGRVVELDRQGDVVWEFINRIDEDEVLEISSALRYPESYFTVGEWACR